jgi:hypothetical protein
VHSVQPKLHPMSLLRDAQGGWQTDAKTPAHQSASEIAELLLLRAEAVVKTDRPGREGGHARQ